jgi:hypothetical protein
MKVNRDFLFVVIAIGIMATFIILITRLAIAEQEQDKLHAQVFCSSIRMNYNDSAELKQCYTVFDNITYSFKIIKSSQGYKELSSNIPGINYIGSDSYRLLANGERYP